VEAGEVLHVRPWPDADRPDVPADHRAEPDAGALGDLDVPDDGGVGGDEDVARDARGVPAEGEDQRHLTPHPSRWAASAARGDRRPPPEREAAPPPGRPG